MIRSSMLSKIFLLVCRFISAISYIFILDTKRTGKNSWRSLQSNKWINFTARLLRNEPIHWSQTLFTILNGWTSQQRSQMELGTSSHQSTRRVLSKCFNLLCPQLLILSSVYLTVFVKFALTRWPFQQFLPKLAKFFDDLTIFCECTDNLVEVGIVFELFIWTVSHHLALIYKNDPVAKMKKVNWASY